MASDRISLCIIVKDEAANLERCLRAAAPASDEIIVVDTGSTDDSPAVAERLGARVVNFAWCDDFAAARNATLEHATGDWILRLDADEELLPESPAAIREVVRRPDVYGALLLRMDVEHPGQTSGFIEERVLRLWRNLPGTHYIHRYHETIEPSLSQAAAGTGMRLVSTEIRYFHTGYQSHLKRAKLERALPLLERENKERPGQLYFEVELGRTWSALGNPRGRALLDQALERLLQHEGDPHSPNIMASALLEFWLRNDREGTRSPRLIPLVERWYPRSIPLLLAIGELHFKAERFQDAADYFARIVRLADTDEYERGIPFPGSLLEDGPLLHLAVCHHRLAHFEEAERWYRILLERYPGHPSGQQNLAVLREQRSMFREEKRPKAPAKKPVGRRR